MKSLEDDVKSLGEDFLWTDPSDRIEGGVMTQEDKKKYAEKEKIKKVKNETSEQKTVYDEAFENAKTQQISRLVQVVRSTPTLHVRGGK
jgi:hypothetical protein